jgi:hypothetical protein
MELIPIIKLALLTFTIVLGVVIFISYVVYKMRNRNNELKPQLAKVPVLAYRNSMRITNHSIPKQVSNNMLREQEFFVPQRSGHVNMTNVNKKQVKARFKVLNQQEDLRKYEVNNASDKAFYYPAVKNDILVPDRSASLLDRYSSGNERLNKLNFNTF